MDESSFLDELYGAAVDPDQWVPVMEKFADLVGGTSGWLARLSMTNGKGSGVLSRIDPGMQPLYMAHYADKNPFSNAADPRAFMSTWTPNIVTDEAWLSKEELEANEYYNDFMKPQDVWSVMMVRLAAQGFNVCAVSINRPESWGRFTSRDLEVAGRLHPHVRRAFHLTEKLATVGLANDDAATALDHSPYGVFLLDETGRVRRANRAAERMIAGGIGLSISGGRLVASAAAAASQLEALIAAAGSSDRAARSGGSMTLRPSGGRSPLSVTVAPVRTNRLAVFDHRPSVVVCVTDPDAGATVSEHRLRGLFGLTPAEARVAVAIMDGATAREVATALGVSFHTVRHQLQSMLDKTGASRQSELVAMLMRAVGPPLS